MKKILLFAASAAALLSVASCNKESNGVSAPEAGAQCIHLTVGVDGAKTKAYAAEYVASNDKTTEAKVNSLEILIFKDDGATLDGYAKVTAPTTVGSESKWQAEVDCTAGSREIYAVVNAPADLHIELVSKKADLLAKVAVIKNEVSNFQMIGSTTAVLKQDTAINIDVYRYASRIVLKEVKNSIPNATQAADFTIKAVYVSNAAADIDFGKSATYSIANWYNQRGYQPGNNLGSFTRDEVAAASGKIAKDAIYTGNHFFYVMPNAATDRACKYAALGADDAARQAAYEALGANAEEREAALEAQKLPLTFSPRSTRLVVLVEIDGEEYVYPIAMPVLQSNKSYEINLLNITRLGNKYNDTDHDGDGNEPDGPTDGEDTGEEDTIETIKQMFEINVVDWDVVLVDNDDDDSTNGHYNI